LFDLSELIQKAIYIVFLKTIIESNETVSVSYWYVEAKKLYSLKLLNLILVTLLAYITPPYLRPISALSYSGLSSIMLLI